MRMYLSEVSATAIVATMLFATPVVAQETTSLASNDAARGTDDSNDIVVTASRREGKLIDVPASVAVVSADQVAQQGIQDFADLALRVPNVGIFQNDNLASRSSVTIRGIPGRAGIFVDNVFVGDNSGVNTLLVDIDRVEVVRGPQGTLYGRNAVSGTINTVTRRPGDEFFAQGIVRYGSFESLYGGAAVGGPIGGGLSAKLSGAYRANDGYDLERGGSRVNGSKSYAFQGQLRFRPTDAIDIWVSGDYQNDDARTGYTDAVADYSINGGSGAVYKNAANDGNAFDRIVPTRNNVNRETREVWGVAGHVDIDLEAIKISSITAYRSINSLFNRDGDGMQFNIISGTQPVRYHQFSQELRLLSPSGGFLEWQVGGYYFKDQRRSSDGNFIGSDFILTVNPGLAPFAPPLAPGGLGGVVTLGRLAASPTLQAILRPAAAVDPTLGAIYAFNFPTNAGTQTTLSSNSIESISAFAQVTLRPIENVEISGGGRFTHETVIGTYGRNAVGLVQFLTPPIATQTLNNGGNNNFSPNASISWRPNNRVTAYFTYSTAFRSGGFNLAPAALVPPADDAQQRAFRPEIVTSYEVGLKTSLLENRLTANIALFRSNYSDLQRSFYRIDPSGFIVNSTFNTSATINGLEIELAARPIRELTFTASYGYQDATYDNYPDAPIASYLIPVPPGRATLTTDLTGQTLPFVPRHSVVLTAEYNRQVGNGLAFNLGSDFQLRSKYNVTDGVDQIRIVSDTTQLGVHVGIGDAHGKWRVTGRVYNLTNQVYRTGLDYNSFVGTVYQSLSAPRTFAIEGSFKF
jgi:iron complex outermembrane receptor protein